MLKRFDGVTGSSRKRPLFDQAPTKFVKTSVKFTIVNCKSATIYDGEVFLTALCNGMIE